MERDNEIHSTKKYWNNPQSEWNKMISLNLIARHDELFIKFYHGTYGSSMAIAKFHVGPAAATEVIWPLLLNGESVDGK